MRPTPLRSCVGLEIVLLVLCAEHPFEDRPDSPNSLPRGEEATGTKNHYTLDSSQRAKRRIQSGRSGDRGLCALTASVSFFLGDASSGIDVLSSVSHGHHNGRLRIVRPFERL